MTIPVSKESRISDQRPPEVIADDMSILQDGSQKSFFDLKDETFFAQIAQNPELSPQQRASQIAAGMLDNISIMLGTERDTWPNTDDLEGIYEPARYLEDTKCKGHTDIVLEVFEERLTEEDIPETYGQILTIANEIRNDLKLGKASEVATTMILVWLVTEADVDISVLFLKIKGRAAGRMAMKNSGTVPKQQKK